MMPRIMILALAGLLTSILACSDDDVTAPIAEGEEGGPCLSDGSCDGDLVCEDDLCVGLSDVCHAIGAEYYVVDLFGSEGTSSDCVAQL